MTCDCLDRLHKNLIAVLGKNHSMPVLGDDLLQAILFAKQDVSQFKVGDAVTYIPGHAHGDRGHPDCEHGVVTNVPLTGDTVFVLYGADYISKGTYISDLVHQ